ncbi:MAG TPA: TIR domain-containing protein [Croceibacterium sp.]|nr:TIR domain-containing protein [Croceibacterium sp.]
MSDIFISYARPNEPQARLAGEALRALGYGVWRDDELPAHRAYSDVIEERIKAAKAVLVLWSADAARSQWVRAEADAAREAGTLVQVSLDGSLPPMPFNQIQCADLTGWNGEGSTPGWQKVVSSIASLAGAGDALAQDAGVAAEPTRRVMVCVVPFINMSGDLEQEYFSDGISEDIIIDLSKVSALSTVPRNLAFELKGKRTDTAALAHDLGVTHVLEGSVRKAGTRVRITAELIDCRNNEQLWGDRYDRELDDIFAIQDEISKAIVAALQLKLLPKEKKAIEQRGTSNSEAYNLYLMARQHWISGNDGDSRRDEIVVRICRQALAVDPNYAKAWALMALAESELRFRHDRKIDPLPAAEKALELDPNLPEAYCVKARYLADEEGRRDEALEQIETALRLDPESWEANKEAAILNFRQGRISEAVPYFEKAAALVEGDYRSSGLLMSCYHGLKDVAQLRRAAEMTYARVEKAISHDQGNGAALGYGAVSLASLGRADRAREWAQRALMIDPDNLTMRYNLACAFASHLHDADAAMELLVPHADQFNAMFVLHFQVDPDLDPIRDDPRFQHMLEGMKARVAGGTIAAK